MEKLWSEDRRLGAFTAFVNLRPSLKPTTGGFRAIRNSRRMLADFSFLIGGNALLVKLREFIAA
jgi:hypothetical protein